MSKYRVLVTDSNEFLASFDDFSEAEECAMQSITFGLNEKSIIRETKV